MQNEEAIFPEFDFESGEVLLVDKPLQWTSFDVVNKIRNTLKPLKLKVGHAGTLDPLATGLLVICTGRKTKTIDILQAQEKEYTGTFIIGATTPTYDLEAAPDKHFSIDDINDKNLIKASQSFIGKIEQYPPAHSAIKVNGERLYEKARRGEKIELKARQIVISEFELTRIELPEVDFRVVCSKGTYIRSLAHDFGLAINNGAYLAGLRRTRNGNYHVKDAYKLDLLIHHLTALKQKTKVETR